jgi:hypothetical protein
MRNVWLASWQEQWCCWVVAGSGGWVASQASLRLPTTTTVMLLVAAGSNLACLLDGRLKTTTTKLMLLAALAPLVGLLVRQAAHGNNNDGYAAGGGV